MEVVFMPIKQLIRLLFSFCCFILVSAKKIKSCLFDFLKSQTTLSFTKGNIQSTTSNTSRILVLYIEEKYQNYYTLEHSGNIPSSFSQDIVWCQSTKGDLLQISILFLDMAFIEIFSSISPFREIHSPLKKAVRKLLFVM